MTTRERSVSVEPGRAHGTRAHRIVSPSTVSRGSRACSASAGRRIGRGDVDPLDAQDRLSVAVAGGGRLMSHPPAVDRALNTGAARNESDRHSGHWDKLVRSACRRSFMEQGVAKPPPPYARRPTRDALYATPSRCLDSIMRKLSLKRGKSPISTRAISRLTPAAAPFSNTLGKGCRCVDVPRCLSGSA